MWVDFFECKDVQVSVSFIANKNRFYWALETEYKRIYEKFIDYK